MFGSHWFQDLYETLFFIVDLHAVSFLLISINYNLLWVFKVPQNILNSKFKISYVCHIKITLPYDAPDLAKSTRSTAALYLACGVDTSKVIYLLSICQSIYAVFLYKRRLTVLCVCKLNRPLFLCNHMCVPM